MGNEVAVIEPEDFAVVKMNANIAEIVKNNLGMNAQVRAQDLDQIKVPSAESRFWNYETIDGEEAVKTLTGVIVFVGNTRVYWASSYAESGGGTPPDCYSTDMINGVGMPGGKCSVCPFAEFGTAIRDDGSAGRGCACQERKFLFTVLPQGALPYVISVPPSSLKGVKKYLLRLASNGLNYYERVAKFELEQAANVDGLKFNRIKIGIAGPIKNIDFWKKYHEDFAPMAQAASQAMAKDMRQDDNDKVSF